MPIDRREFIAVVASQVVSWSCCALLNRSDAQVRPQSGCMLAEAAFSRISFLDASVPNQLEAVRSFKGVILDGSGNSDFDAALGRQVLSPLSLEFGVNPGFGFYEEDKHLEYGDENALASTLVRIARTRGTVVFGLNLLRNFLRVDGGDFAIMAICAHEFGHIKQYGLDAKSAIEQGLPSYCIELHADFLAGYFVRLFSERVPATRLQVIGEQWSKLGHPTDPGSHGTSTQRVKAIEAGYDFAKKSTTRTIDMASNAGYAHVSQYRA
jgi:hypothetical protein